MWKELGLWREAASLVTTTADLLLEAGTCWRKFILSSPPPPPPSSLSLHPLLCVCLFLASLGSKNPPHKRKKRVYIFYPVGYEERKVTRKRSKKQTHTQKGGVEKERKEVGEGGKTE